MTPKFAPESKAIAMHLSYSPPQDGYHVFSGFAAALRESRVVTGRDPATGEKLSGRSHGSWLGAMQDNETTVSLEAFDDLVEGIVLQLIEFAQQDELEVLLQGGSDELLQRYGVFART